MHLMDIYTPGHRLHPLPPTAQNAAEQVNQPVERVDVHECEQVVGWPIEWMCGL